FRHSFDRFSSCYLNSLFPTQYSLSPPQTLMLRREDSPFFGSLSCAFPLLPQSFFFLFHFLSPLVHLLGHWLKFASNSSYTNQSRVSLCGALSKMQFTQYEHICGRSEAIR